MVQTAANRIVLGSASPRRRQLLSLFVGQDRIKVLSPDCEELALAEPMTSEEVDAGLRENVRRKYEAISNRIGKEEIALCADTVVVVRESDQQLRCLGKPPLTGWQAVVSHWFESYYVREPHWVRTCFSVTSSGKSVVQVVQTEVEFQKDATTLLPWYLKTQEPIGKAGGYALQGAGSMFAARVSGSLSNVIGLPLEEVLSALQSAGVE
jgi:septum formation protein